MSSKPTEVQIKAAYMHLKTGDLFNGGDDGQSLLEHLKTKQIKYSSPHRTYPDKKKHWKGLYDLYDPVYPDWLLTYSRGVEIPKCSTCPHAS